MRVKRLGAFLMVCALGVSACGKSGSDLVAENSAAQYDAVISELTDGSGEHYDVLHGCLYDICSSSATDNAFMTKPVTDEGGIGYSFNSTDFTFEEYTALENSLKVMPAKELCEFELLAYASYLDRTGDAFSSSLSPKSQRILFDYMSSVYEKTAGEATFSSAVSDAMGAYYGDLKAAPVSKISYDINGNYLGIQDSALMTGLFALGNGETVASCYATRKGTETVPYTSEDGGQATITVYPSEGIVIASKGTVIGYECITFDDSDEFVLRDVYYLAGGGCLNGEVAEEDKPLSEDKTDQMFFGERSLGSLATMERRRTFEKLVTNFRVTTTSMPYAIQQDIGIKLVASMGVYSGGMLMELGYEPEGTEVVATAVGCAPFTDDSTYGDLYGWYAEEVPTADGQHTCRVEGFAILHSRDYGFSAENYLRLF
jgi:hypothetical protein